MIRNQICCLGLCIVLAIAGGVSAQTQPAAQKKKTNWLYPKIKKYGKVVRLPKAAEQPEAGSKLVVDLIRKGDPKKLNPAIAKIARYVKLYAGAGKHHASVSIVVVMHGDATICSLNDSGYRRHSGVAKNPNLTLIDQLKKAGVLFYVCGQALSHKQYAFSEVHENVTVGVSALTALVNHQQKGYAYLPMH